MGNVGRNNWQSVVWKVDGYNITLRFAENDGTLTDLKLLNWGDGSGVPTSGDTQIIAGIDNKGLLHVRIFDVAGPLALDEDETKLPIILTGAAATLKHEIASLSPPHILTSAEKIKLITDVKAVFGQPQDRGRSPDDLNFNLHWDKT